MGVEVVNEEKMNKIRRDLDNNLKKSRRLEIWIIFFWYNISSERESLEITKATYENAVRKLETDESLIGKKTSALAILYKQKCLVDKSKSDAVKTYLNYQIKKAETDSRHTDAEQLKQELKVLSKNLSYFLNLIGHYLSNFNYSSFSIISATQSSWSWSWNVEKVFFQQYDRYRQIKL